MDYNKLKTFTVVADLQSVTIAANNLRRSQSAISQQIQQLEDELSLRLFERRAGKIYLSPQGEGLHQFAKEKLGAIDDEVKRYQNQVSKVEGHIRLGILNDKSNRIEIDQMIAQYCKTHPNVDFHIELGTNHSIEPDLIENKIDLGISVVFRQREMFTRYPIFQEEQIFATSAEYLKGRGRPCRSYQDIIDADLIDLSEDFICTAFWFRKNAPKHLPSLLHRRPNIVVADHRRVKNMIVAGFGMAVIPVYLIERELEKGVVVPVLKSAKSTYIGVDIAVRSNRTLRLCERLFIEHVTKKKVTAL